MMDRRMSALCGAGVMAMAMVSVFSLPLSGQRQTARPASAAIPRTPDGHPDFHGVYDIATLTPIERPDAAKGKLSLTDQEAAAIEGAERSRVNERALPSPVDRAAPPIGGNVGGYNNFWIDR